MECTVDDLKDVLLPDSISLWPVAYGWWLLLICLILALLILLFLIRRRHIKNRPKNYALKKLDAIAISFENQHLNLAERQSMLSEINQLLKRLAMHHYGCDDHIQSLYGQAWLLFLDDKGNTHAFSKGPGAVLGQQLYNPKQKFTHKPLLTICRTWIKKHY